jgi:hypothetical protein
MNMYNSPPGSNESDPAVTLQKPSFTFIRVIFVVNIIVTGVVGSTALFATSKAPQIVFQEAYESNDSMKMIGAFWIAILVCSAIGLWNPLEFSPVMIIQIIYKGLFLIVEVLPKLIKK